MHDFEIVEELEEHHPGEQRQAIHIPVEAFVLAQNLRAVPISADSFSRVVSGVLALRGARAFFQRLVALAIGSDSRYWYSAVCSRETASFMPRTPPK